MPKLELASLSGGGGLEPAGRILISLPRVGHALTRSFGTDAPPPRQTSDEVIRVSERVELSEREIELTVLKYEYSFHSGFKKNP